ncbi:histidine kinase [Pseudomonas sp. NPDC089752]|uniref:histidine kinase n=1 Tax=Pseudomonas sp. NPDC089752 TaxID=3364472 RepID=UPI003815058A
MHQPYVLIHQARPSHQILLHQACNAQRIFDVRITLDLADLDACLGRKRKVDLLILDHALALAGGVALLNRIQRNPTLRALLFTGQGSAHRPDLAKEARRRGLWVLADLPWPLPVQRWQQALQRIQTVTSPTHAQ